MPDAIAVIKSTSPKEIRVSERKNSDILTVVFIRELKGPINVAIRIIVIDPAKNVTTINSVKNWRISLFCVAPNILLMPVSRMRSALLAVARLMKFTIASARINTAIAKMAHSCFVEMP